MEGLDEKYTNTHLARCFAINTDVLRPHLYAMHGGTHTLDSFGMSCIKSDI